LLGYSLDSLLNQTVGKDRFEVIVSDDGSSDNTKEVVDKYSCLMNMKYMYQEDKGYRPASARNKAIGAAEGRICLFIDSSVLLHQDCIAQHILFHTKSEAPACGIGYVYGFDHTDQSDELLKKLVVPTHVDRSIRELSRYEFFKDVRESHYIKYSDNLSNLPAPWYYFWTCHASVATNDVIRNGMFDENYDGKWGVEDNDLGFRLHRAGIQFSLLRAAMAIHYPHGKDKTGKLMEGYFNSLYFHNKFNTAETALFQAIFQAASSAELVDINALCIHISQPPAQVYSRSDNSLTLSK
jgi:glycosyltransferase involved in cell wall biosynthesis